MLFKANHCLVEQNMYAPNMGCGIENTNFFDSNNNQCVLNRSHRYWLILSNVVFSVISMIVDMCTDNFIMAYHEIYGPKDYGFVCLKFLVKRFIL